MQRFRPIHEKIFASSGYDASYSRLSCTVSFSLLFFYLFFCPKKPHPFFPSALPCAQNLMVVFSQKIIFIGGERGMDFVDQLQHDLHRCTAQKKYRSSAQKDALLCDMRVRNKLSETRAHMMTSSWTRTLVSCGCGGDTPALQRVPTGVKKNVALLSTLRE